MTGCTCLAKRRSRRGYALRPSPLCRIDRHGCFHAVISGGRSLRQGRGLPDSRSHAVSRMRDRAGASRRTALRLVGIERRRTANGPMLARRNRSGARRSSQRGSGGLCPAQGPALLARAAVKSAAADAMQRAQTDDGRAARRIVARDRGPVRPGAGGGRGVEQWDTVGMKRRVASRSAARTETARDARLLRE